MLLSFLFFIFDDRFKKRDERFFLFPHHLHNGRTVFDVEGVLLLLRQLDVVFADAVSDE